MKILSDIKLAAMFLRSSLYLDLHRPGPTVLLAGDGRSGTTWLSKVINHDESFRYIFEPFFGEKVPLFEKFTPHPYLRPEEHAPEFERCCRELFQGRIRGLWPDVHNRKRLPTNRRLIKAIRANFCLAWLRRRFPELKIVFLIRNPYAVANSKRRFGWKSSVDHLLDQPRLMEDHLGPHAAMLHKASTPYERYILQWCAINHVALRQLGRDEIFIAFYEDFCTQPETKIPQLFSYLGIPYDQAVLRKTTRPSPTCKKHSAIKTGENLVDSWKKHTSEDELLRAQPILEAFGLDRLYDDAGMPGQDAPQKMQVHLP
ncbi:sulfotransferase [Kiritimatiella glycovorans]|uniref:Sulfotransferase domain protein n=1 Tax=Kiritimatiella glycovorans TaxID=1307763 RepID=A0A0G3EGP4_9BACT|nr:sulfotransferase [Kiritimatiella glycovorans]AKJ65523.1 Sulfotransferase domain protein [Kiritimatiella glycovorans]